MKELQEIDNFLAGKDEMALRETFDFPNMIQYNVRLTRREMFPKYVTPGQSAEIDNFFRGNAQAYAKYFTGTSAECDRITRAI